MQEIFRVALRNLSHQKTRTALTLLGVVIGIAAVIALVSVGRGLEASVRDSLESLGPDRIIVTPHGVNGFGPPAVAQGLTDKELEIVERNRKIDKVLPVVFKNFPVKYSGETKSISITGVPPESEDFFSDVRTFELSEGRSFLPGDRNVAIIGYRIAEEAFTSNVDVRSKLSIIGKDVRVIGIMKPTGNQQDDSGILIPIDMMREITGNDKEISAILAKVREDPKGTAQEIEKDLEDLHGEKLFVVLTTEQLISQINSVFGIISLVLISIASISLVVAGFGIMNTMLMAVIERTREIGIMKAIGATDSRILSMFVAESSVVGLIGGIVGTIIGYAVSFGLASATVTFFNLNLLIEVDPVITAGILVFSTLVGTISGAYPSWRAARLDPVEALRHE